MHEAFIDALRTAAEADGRVRAAWLEGSFGKSTADRYSDVDAHLLIDSDRIEAFRKEAKSWLSEIRPLVLFTAKFDGQMLNALTVDGLRVDVWLHGDDSVSLAGKSTLVLFEKPGSIDRESTPEQGRHGPDAAAKIEAHIGEFWRGMSILPAVLGREELITGMIAFFPLTFPLTEVLIIGSGVARDAGVKALNCFLAPDVRKQIESALTMDGLSVEGVARAHLRLAGVMQQRAPAIAEQLGVAYPHDLERAVVDYLEKELQLLGLEDCLRELYRRPK